jgi:restriction endonuclease S subunit
MECVLKDLIAISKDGEWGKGEPFEDSIEMLAIRGTDFDKVRFGDMASTPRRHIPNRIADRKTLRPWDVIIEAAGGTKNQITGRTVLLRPQLFSRSELPFTCASFSRFIRFNTKLCDSEFMFWYLQHLYASGFMHAYHTQHTGVARFQWTTFSEREPLELPPLPVQRRIASILSAYDELIENSQRRIRILEAMARALYREWFVHFRFPGHERVPHIASSLDDIPRGWEVKPLSKLCSRMESGGTPKRKTAEYWEGGDIDWFKTGELWDGFLFASEEKITERGQRESNARLFEPGTILMAIYGSPTVGRLGIVTRPSSCNQAALGVVADTKKISQTFLYFVLLSLRDHFNALAQGAAQQNISKEKVASTVALDPPRPLVAAFDRLAEPTFSQIQSLQRQTQNLRRTRDLLLPRLLAGQQVPKPLDP